MQHYKALKHRLTHKCTTLWMESRLKEKRHKLYAVNIHKNSTQSNATHSLRKLCEKKIHKVFQRRIVPIPQLCDNIQCRDFSTTSEACIFLAIFLLYSAQCLSVSECKTRQSWLQTVLSHRTTHHSTASATFEAPWMEHAQWHPVNKSLVEASVAVAHLVRLCTDPESATQCTASSYRFKGQTGLRNALDDELKSWLLNCLVSFLFSVF